MDAQDVRQFPHENLSPETATMTLEEFLESDLEGYEYVKGEFSTHAAYIRGTW